MKEIRILDSDQTWSIDRPCTLKILTPMYHCPGCNKPGHRRSGVGFEHQYRCGACSLVWEPERTIALVTFNRKKR